MIEYLEGLVADVVGRDKKARILAPLSVGRNTMFEATASYQAGDGTWVELATVRRDSRIAALMALATELMKLREKKWSGEKEEGSGT